MSSTISSPSPIVTATSPVQLFDTDTMFDHHPIRYLLQCARHPTTTAASSTSGMSSGAAASTPTTLSLKLRIPTTETRTEEGGKKTYTVFLIQIMSCCASFSVLRRYSDFCNLHRDLLLEFPALSSKLPTLPGKKLLGSSLDAEFVATRRTQLEAYLLKLFGDATFVNSKSITQFFVTVREVNGVQVKIGSNATSRTTSASSADNNATFDAAQLTSRMSSIAQHLISLEQKLKWVEASSGGHQSQSVEHDLKMMNNTLESLKKKVGVLELAQPYLQQMASSNNKPVNPLASSSGMNGNARPFQSGHRSVSGPVGSLRYDWTQDDYLETADEEEEDDFGVLPKRSISQRVATNEKRPFTTSSGWPSTLSSSAYPDSTHGSPSGLEEGEERGRSLSESHITDRFAQPAVTFNTVNLSATKATREASISPANQHGAITVRSVLDNSSRSLSSIDPWHAHKFQLRNRTESMTGVTTQRLPTRQHSDPLAANPNSAMHWYKAWVEELGIEVGTGGTGAPTSSSASQHGDEVKSGGYQSNLHKSASEGQNLLSNEKASLFAGFGNAFPFIGSRKRASGEVHVSAPTTQSTTSTLPTVDTPTQESVKHSLFALPLTLPPAAISSTNTTVNQQTSSPTTPTSTATTPSLAIALPKPSVAHPSRLGTSGRSASPGLGTSPELPHSPELGGSPNLDSPELQALTAANNRTTLSPRAYGISPVNLATIFPPPNLRNRKDSSVDDDDEERGSFMLKFEKEKVAAKNGESALTTGTLSSSTTLSTTSTNSTALTTTIPLEDALLECNTNSVLFECCTDQQLNSRMNDLLTFISPSTSSEARYNSVLQFIDALIKRQIGAEVFCHGSFALKTYLPDADLDVSAFFSKVHEETWVQKLVGALCQEAAIPTVGSQYAVKSVSFINAVVQVVKCQIGSISVDISGNQTGALATLALFEEVDKLVGQNHLFKRTILLTKTWCQNEAGIVDSGAGMLSSYCIRAFVLYIFNAYHTQIKTPFQGLFMLLAYFGQFDFMEHAVGVYGPIQLSALPKFQVVVDCPCAWPQDTIPLVSRELLSAYSLVATAPSTGPSHKHKSANETLVRTYLNVTDPCNPFNNLGRSVSQQHSPTIRQAFKTGSIQMRKMLTEWNAYMTRRAQESKSMTSTTEELEDADAMEAYQLVSKMFPKTLSVYSTFGGRGRFVAPRRRGPRGLSTLSESGQSSRIASGQASPALAHSSPMLKPTQSTLPPDMDTIVTNQHNTEIPVRPANATPSPSPPAPTPLDANLPRILDNLNQARQFETPDVSESDLVSMIRKLLLQYGSVPVGKLGSLLHNVMNNHSLPSMLKERYGGLKKFLERHTDSFIIGSDHPFNPSTHLSPAALVLAQKESEEQALADHQAQLAQLAANGPQSQQHQSHGPQSTHGNSNNNFSSHQSYGGNNAGGGRGQQLQPPHSGHYHQNSMGGRGQQRSPGGQQQSQYQNQQQMSHHHQNQNHYNNPNIGGGNGPMYNNPKPGQHGGGGRYGNQQTNLNSAAVAALQQQQLQQQQQQQPSYTAHPSYPLHHQQQPLASYPSAHPTSPLPHAASPSIPNGYVNPQLGGYSTNPNSSPLGHLNPRGGVLPVQSPTNSYPGPLDSDYAYDFPTLTGILKQHR